MESKSEKKQIIVRLSFSLWQELNKWAEDEFRSFNGQIEYLLTDLVKSRRKKEIDLDKKNS